MAWSLFEERYKHHFTQTFTEKYTLTIDTDVMLGSVLMKSKTEIRWLIEIKNVVENQIDLNIITLHHRVLESNNPIITDISNISSTFGNMFSELELKINDKGEIIKIKNLNIIQKKWQWVKQDMQKYIDENEALKDIILLNDELYSSEEMIKKSIASNEFFSIYFHLFFGKRLPNSTGEIQKNNLFNTHTLKWFFEGFTESNYTPQHQKPIILKLIGFTRTKINKEWQQKAYAGFEHLPLQDAKPTFEDKATYTILPCGKIISAIVERSEIVLPQLLYTKYCYELIAEGEVKEAKIKTTPLENKDKPTISPKDWLIID